MEIFKIIIVAASAIFVAFTGFNWKESNWKVQTGAILAGIVAIAIAINEIKDWRKDETKEKEEELEKRIKTMFGDIEDSGNESIPAMEIGYSGTIIRLIGDGPLFRISGAPLIDLRVKSGKLFVTCVVRDKSGKPIAVIDHNEWEMVNPEYDYNNDETAFEVVTKGDRRILLSVELKDGRAHLIGEFYSESGYGVTFFPAPGGAIMARSTPDMPPKRVPSDAAAPLFKYPRARYLGHRANP